MQVYYPRKVPDKFRILVSQLQNFTSIHECSEAYRCHVAYSIIAKAKRKKKKKREKHEVFILSMYSILRQLPNTIRNSLAWLTTNL